MIETVADLLEQVMKDEIDSFQSFSFIKHPVIRGNMYEGLTQKILERAIFKDLNLRVVGGFIKASNKQISNEIDCMLVTGEGMAIPNNYNKYVYEVAQVIAVIQVKKTLYSSQLKDGIQNVNSIFDFKETFHVDSRHYHMANDIYRVLGKEVLTCKGDYESLPEHKQKLYDSFLADCAFPLRIIWGFDGFASENGLRRSLIELVDEQTTAKDRFLHGPQYLPNLIICGQNTLVKTNAMPYGGTTFDGRTYVVLASTNQNPFILFLETLWTRLTYLFQDLPVSIFGEDLENEQMHGLLTCEYFHDDRGRGWNFGFLEMTDEQLEHPLGKTSWRPVELNRLQAQVIRGLCQGKVIDLKTDQAFQTYVRAEGFSFDQFVEGLLDTELVFARNNCLHLLTEQCGLVCFRGKWYAGENKSGRMERWLKNMLESAEANEMK
jgi:hypothetical protein